MTSSPPPGRPWRFDSFTMVLPTFNEEARIARVLEYYRPFARILVVDNFSTDRTVEIARGMGLEVIRHANQGTTQTPEWLRHVATLFETDYVLFLACSEFIPVPLLEKLDEVARTRSADVVSCVRTSYTCGEPFPALWGPAPRVERLMNKRAIDYEGVVIHGAFAPAAGGRTLTLPAAPELTMSHLRDADAFSLVAKHAAYARVEADHRLARGQRVGLGWLASALWSECVALARVLLAGANRIALREVWARVVMHSMVYWIAWENRSGKGADYSRTRSTQLWEDLVHGEEARREAALRPDRSADVRPS